MKDILKAHFTRVSLWSFKKCPNKRHSYIDGFCACGQMSRQEYHRLRREAQKEIAAYEYEQAQHRAYYEEAMSRP